MAVTRLRTEVIVNLILVVGTALVFSGVLLLYLAERELLDQQVQGTRRGMELTAQALALLPESELRAGAARQLLDVLRPQSWYLLGPDQQLLASETATPAAGPESNELLRARSERSSVTRVNYTPWWLPWRRADSSVLVTVALEPRGDSALLQARFTLDGVESAMARARRFFLVYLGLYLVVLVAFGVYLLNRTVIGPLLALRQATGRVATGNLDEPVAGSGPAEIGELAASFNGMLASLRASRGETEASIASLQQANARLQQTQAELLRSEKLASVGRLAAGMAHEIGNPLGAVVGYLGYLRAEQADPSPTADILDRAQGELQRIDRLVRDLLDYAAPVKESGEAVDPATVLAEARELLQHQGHFDGLRLQDDLPASLPTVCMARHKLLQVAVNLLLNARDAVPAGGSIALSGGEGEQEVWLEVRDSGSGIDPDLLPQIFDPFFTTKAPGRGRGLGLAVCHRIIEEAGGRIAVTSTPGAGSAFRITLPRSDCHA